MQKHPLCQAPPGKHPARPWRIRGGRWILPSPFLVAGIVNLTPDSFSDGGRYVRPCSALLRIREVVAQGAGMVDLGAESTRPDADDIGQAEEWRRLLPVLRETLDLRAAGGLAPPSPPEASSWYRPLDLRFADPDADKPGAAERQGDPFVVAVDTWRAETAAAALALRPASGGGLDVINDVSGGGADPGMAEVLAEFQPGYVLGHSPCRPGERWSVPGRGNVVEALLDWFTARMDALVRRGLPESCIVLDPCIGFGKDCGQTLEIIRALPRFQALGRPLYFGLSRKSFLGALTGLPLERRDSPTQAATALLAASGVSIHRVHQVEEAVATLVLVSAFTALCGR